MGNFLEICFNFYCNELIEAKEEFVSNFSSHIDTYTNDKLHLSENETKVDKSKKRLFNAIDCLAVIVNHHLDVPRDDSKQYVLDVILEKISADKRVILMNDQDNTKKLEYEKKSDEKVLNEFNKKALELYARLYMLGTSNPLNY